MGSEFTIIDDENNELCFNFVKNVKNETLFDESLKNI